MILAKDSNDIAIKPAINVGSGADEPLTSDLTVSVPAFVKLYRITSHHPLQASELKEVSVAVLTFPSGITEFVSIEVSSCAMEETTTTTGAAELV